MDVGKFRSLFKLRNIHPEARPVLVPGLEVADTHERRGGRLVVHDVGAAVGNASFGPWFCSTWSPNRGVLAEVCCDTALSPDVAACIQRTRVEIRKIFSTFRFLRARLLRSTLCICNGVRHWGIAFAQTNHCLVEQEFAPRPAPGILVETPNVFDLERVCSSNLVAKVP